MQKESKMKCDKCGSEDVLVGNMEKPNHCNDCEHEWKVDNDSCTITACESVLHSPIVCPQPILFTLNKNYRTNNRLKLQIDEALKHI